MFLLNHLMRAFILWWRRRRACFVCISSTPARGRAR